MLHGTAYINLTNRCCNDCNFCIRQNADTLCGNTLWLAREPSADEVIAQLTPLIALSKEAVFCGYGEPTYRLDEILAVSAFIRTHHKKVRLNTNGLGGLINGFDIVPLLQNSVHSVSVSLNASGAESYQQVCRPVFGPNAFAEVLSFIQRCVLAGIETTATVVDVSRAEHDACKALAESLGASFRLRGRITDNESYQ